MVLKKSSILLMQTLLSLSLEPIMYQTIYYRWLALSDLTSSALPRLSLINFSAFFATFIGKLQKKFNLPAFLQLINFLCNTYCDKTIYFFVFGSWDGGKNCTCIFYDVSENKNTTTTHQRCVLKLVFLFSFCLL